MTQPKPHDFAEALHAAKRGDWRGVLRRVSAWQAPSGSGGADAIRAVGLACLNRKSWPALEALLRAGTVSVPPIWLEACLQQRNQEDLAVRLAPFLNESVLSQTTVRHSRRVSVAAAAALSGYALFLAALAEQGLADPAALTVFLAVRPKSGDFQAIEHNASALVPALLALGGSLERVDRSEGAEACLGVDDGPPPRTPLELAIRCGRFGAALALLEAGANPLARVGRFDHAEGWTTAVHALLAQKIWRQVQSSEPWPRTSGPETTAVALLKRLGQHPIWEEKDSQGRRPRECLNPDASGLAVQLVQEAEAESLVRRLGQAVDADVPVSRRLRL